jgi:hypothetical protein
VTDRSGSCLVCGTYLRSGTGRWQEGRSLYARLDGQTVRLGAACDKHFEGIFFNVREARDHLLETGEVLTLRVRRGTGQTVAYTGNRRERTRLCSVLVEFAAADPPRSLLETNVDGSGFLTVDAWLSAASPESNVLYRVRRIGP